MSDEDLVDALISASLPELASRRDALLEILRARFEDLPLRAIRAAKASPSLEEPFAAWFWSYERLASSLASYRRGQARGTLQGYLFVKAKWLLRDFFRHRKRHPEPALLADPPPGSGAPGPLDALAEGEERARMAAAVRACVERLGPVQRVPLKLVHIQTLALEDEDWEHLAARAGRPRAALEDAVEARRRAGRTTLTLAEVGSIMSLKLHTVGTYVARAMRAVALCARRRLGREGGAP